MSTRGHRFCRTIENVNQEEVRSRVKDIEKLVGDPEAAHAAEDGLYVDVLRAIASGACTNPEMCAWQALRTQDLIGTRWYA